MRNICGSFFFAYLFFFLSCQSGSEQSSATQQQQKNTQASQETIMKGVGLSQQYCQRCHLYTPPHLLPKHIWKDEVLPRMGAFMGIYEKESRQKLVEKGAAEEIVRSANVYPIQPQIKQEDWEAIKAYYLAKAPESLGEEKGDDSLEIRNVFTASVPGTRITPPMTTMIDYKEESGLIYHSDVKKDISTLNIFDASGQMIQAIALRSPAAQMREKEGDLWVLAMGSFTSTDAPTGQLLRISKKQGAAQYNAVEVMIDSLQRPVDVTYADFDQDGDEDVVIAEFGNWAGRLKWFEHTESGNYERHMLINKTGATEVLATDLNDDGLTDILAMIAQGDESVYALINQGNGKFSQQKIIQLPPTHGSVYFDYVDINRDGIKDIIHVSGDNADYEAIVKPYHGIRIYLGQKGLTFADPYFLPQNGAYKTIPKDFDGDGDLDLASISFFPNYSGAAKESFLMLENVSEGNSLRFKAFTIPGYASSRWIVMDSGDINQDGKPDLMLGSFVVQNPYGDQSGIKKEWMSNSPMFVILENKWIK